jgi:uncharacterized protein
MKFLLVIVVVLIGFYVWRNNRHADMRDDARSHRPDDRTLPEPQDMVSCPVCTVHLPRNDASTGKKGLYCSDEHRDQAER